MQYKVGSLVKWLWEATHDVGVESSSSGIGYFSHLIANKNVLGVLKDQKIRS